VPGNLKKPAGCFTHAFGRKMTAQEERVELHIKKAATMPRIIRSRHNPRTSHLGIPAKPQKASNAATTARMSIDTAHDNILFSLEEA
jgi:hypothetical protein